VEVIDIRAGQRVRTLSGLGEPQGLFYDASTNRLFVASGLDGTTKLFDGATFQLLETVKFSDDADNIRYDVRGRRVIVGYGGEKALRGRREEPGALGILDSNGKKRGRSSSMPTLNRFSWRKPGPRFRECSGQERDRSRRRCKG